MTVARGRACRQAVNVRLGLVRVQGETVERSNRLGVLRRAFLVLFESHAVVSLVLALLPFDGGWADDLGVVERAAGGGLWIFVFLAGPVLVVTFIAWAVIAWYASDGRQLAAGWGAALVFGWLGALPVAGEGGTLEPVVLAAAACGQGGAWLLRRFVLRPGATATPAG